MAEKIKIDKFGTAIEESNPRTMEVNRGEM